VVATSPVNTLNTVFINDGQFMPGDGSEFHSVSIGTDGILKPQPGASLTVTGSFGSDYAFVSLGSFIANESKVIFAGSVKQMVSSSLVFYDVEVNRPDDAEHVEGALTVQNSLAVLDGRAFFNGTFHDVFIAAGGTFTARNSLNVSGDWTN